MTRGFPSELAGRFRPVRRLASGGFGTVWLAEQVALDRQVALKLLHAEHAATPELVARFHDEARVIASLSHPGIVRLLDHGVDGDTPWMAFEYLEGSSLRTLVKRGPVPWPDVIDVARQVAAALAEAHARGVIHRDLKPDNIIESAPGVVKLADFGVAKWAQGSVRTVAGVILGTPAYMSPAQLAGEAAGEQADLHALGVTLFELLTGRRPFLEDDPARLAAIVRSSPAPSVRSLKKEVPAALERIVERLVSTRRADWFTGAAELVTALDGLLTAPELRDPTRVNRRLTRPHVRPPVAQLAAAIGLSCALAIVAVGRYASMRPPRRPPPRASIAPVEDTAVQVSQIIDSAERIEVASWELGRRCPSDFDVLSPIETFEIASICSAAQRLVESYSELVRAASELQRRSPRAWGLLRLERTGYRLVVTLDLVVRTALAARGTTPHPAFHALLAAIRGLERALADGARQCPLGRVPKLSLAPALEAFVALRPMLSPAIIGAASLAAAHELKIHVPRDRSEATQPLLMELAVLDARAAEHFKLDRRKTFIPGDSAFTPSTPEERAARREVLDVLPWLLTGAPDLGTRDLALAHRHMGDTLVGLLEDPRASFEDRRRSARALDSLLRLWYGRNAGRPVIGDVIADIVASLRRYAPELGEPLDVALLARAEREFKD